MAKKILAICAALVAFAAMAAAPAFASPNLTLRENGVSVPTGSLIQATQEGNIVFNTGVGPVTCTTSTLTGKVTTNSGTEVAGNVEKASFTGTGAEGKCTTAFIGDVKVDPEALPWCIKAGGKLATDTFEIRGGGCSESSKSLQFTLTGSATCTYTRANVTGSYNTTGTQAILTIGASQTFNGVAGNSFICPSSGTLVGKYKLETDASPATPLTLDDVA
jgi:hypothetical protein